MNYPLANGEAGKYSLAMQLGRCSVALDGVKDCHKSTGCYFDRSSLHTASSALQIVSNLLDILDTTSLTTAIAIQNLHTILELIPRDDVRSRASTGIRIVERSVVLCLSSRFLGEMSGE